MEKVRVNNIHVYDLINRPIVGNCFSGVAAFITKNSL